MILYNIFNFVDINYKLIWSIYNIIEKILIKDLLYFNG
jgi:hypothetical protein